MIDHRPQVSKGVLHVLWRQVIFKVFQDKLSIFNGGKLHVKHLMEQVMPYQSYGSIISEVDDWVAQYCLLGLLIKAHLRVCMITVIQYDSFHREGDSAQNFERHNRYVRQICDYDVWQDVALREVIIEESDVND